jgi:hypothetical protein
VTNRTQTQSLEVYCQTDRSDLSQPLPRRKLRAHLPGHRNSGETYTRSSTEPVRGHASRPEIPLARQAHAAPREKRREGDQGEFNPASSQSASQPDYGNPRRGYPYQRRGLRSPYAYCGRSSRDSEPSSEQPRIREMVRGGGLGGASELTWPREAIEVARHGRRRRRAPDPGPPGANGSSRAPPYVTPPPSEAWNGTTCIHSRPSETQESIEKNEGVQSWAGFGGPSEILPIRPRFVPRCCVGGRGRERIRGEGGFFFFMCV